MIADLKPYPEYKESGLPWLGDIPRHWASERAKWLFTKMDRPVREEDEVVTCFRDGMVTLRKNRRLRGFTEATAFSGYQGIRKGDLVIHGMDAFAGAIGVSDSDGKGTPVYNVCQPRSGSNAAYYAQLVRQMSQSQWILALAKGIRERSTDFRFEMFGNQRVPSPPIAEQEAIVRFLDLANRRIARNTLARRKVIALLNEQKRAIINRAVTRGLSPAVALKSTGLDSVRDVPTHWKAAVRIKFISSLKGRLGWQGLKAGEYSDSGPYVVSSAHYKNEKINWTKCPHVTEKRYDRDENIQLSEGDILLMKDGAAMGKLAFVQTLPGKACLNSHLLLFRTLFADGQARYSPKFLFYFMLAQPFQSYIQVNGTGSTFQGISQEALGNFKICLPPLQEQIEIAAFLDNETIRQDAAIELEERQIRLIHEFRTRLISDVVTGKLDVRQAAPAIPDEVLSVDSVVGGDPVEIDEDSEECAEEGLAS